MTSVECKHFWYIDGDCIECVYCRAKRTRFDPSDEQTLVSANQFKSFIKAILNTIRAEKMDRAQIVALLDDILIHGIKMPEGGTGNE